MKKIMVIDDDRKFLDEISETLISGGYDVIAVNDPNLVMKIAGMKRPDVILIDIKMPAKSGFEVANELKNFSGHNKIPIIGMTGFYRDEDLPLMNICGIQKCIKKPFYPLDMIYQIEKALR